MKNFFKKLSFVLAIAMVLTSIAPATASAAETVVPAKKVNIKVDGEKTTSIEMDVEETETVKIGLPVKKAFKGQKSTYKTWAVTEGTAVEVVRVGNRTYELTAVEAGEATITINAAKTKKLAKAGEGKSATLTVVVNAPETELTVAQTGANKIAVTGANLTDAKADYVVKRGSVTLTINSVALNEEKTEAVLTAASSSMPKGDYTLAFAGAEAVEFTVVDAEVAKIVIDPECAIMVAGSTTSAVAYYKVYNQFDEDVTKGVLGSYVKVSGSDNATLDRANKKITFTNANGYTMNLSQVSAALVCEKNGVNVSKILTVTEAPKLAEITFAGVRVLKDGVWVETTLPEGLSTAKLNQIGYRLFFKGVDQYGMAYNPTAIINNTSFQLNLSSTTGLNVGTPENVFNYGDYTSYLAYPVVATANYNNGALKEGTVTILGVVLTSGKTVSDSFTVAPIKKVDTLVIAELNGIYADVENTLYFEAYSQNGEAITDYETLSKLNSKLSASSTNVEFKRNADGSARLTYVGLSNNSTISVPDVITCMTETGKFVSTQISVQPVQVATAVIGIDSTVALAGTSSAPLTLTKTDFIFEDQYGNVLPDYSAAVAAAKLYVAPVTGHNPANYFTGYTTVTANAIDVVSMAAVCATEGAVSFTAQLLNADNTAKAGSDYTFALYSVDIEKITDFTIDNFDLEHAGQVGEIAGDLHYGNYGASKVSGMYNGIKVTLLPSDYTLLSDATPGSIDEDKEGFVTKTGKVVIAINNNAGTQVTKEYQYSNAPSVVAYADVYASWDYTSFYYSRLLTTTNAAVTTDDLTAGVVFAVDQYGVASAENPLITISNYDLTDCTLTKNGTPEAAITFKSNGYKTVHVTYAYASGVTVETDVTVKVESVQ